MGEKERNGETSYQMKKNEGEICLEYIKTKILT